MHVTEQEDRLKSCSEASLQHQQKGVLMARGHAILVMVAISVGALSATADPLFRQLEPFSGKVISVKFDAQNIGISDGRTTKTAITEKDRE